MTDARHFTTKQRRYLESLPAVTRVTGTRISYADWFRDDCMRRYEAGASPTQLFREAGLDPQLIGNKRIERCFARWKRRRLNAPSEQRESDALESVTLPASPGVAAGTAVVYSEDDPRDHLIAYQALRIKMLEQEVRALHMREVASHQ